MEDKDILLSVRNLKVYFNSDAGIIKAVNGIDFDLHRGETLGIVGESGSGKSVTSLSILRILDENGFIESGEIIYKGSDIVKLTDHEMQKIRGKEIAMIFQEPMTAMNPVFTVGFQIQEPMELHLGMSKKESRDKAEELLRKTGIPEPGKCLGRYPHELSGGMRQRAMIAMALSCNPAILIADEPTTSLDVTIQAQILELMKDLQNQYGMAIIFITHDLGIIAEITDRAIVMYGGEEMETGLTKSIYKNPLHPYTWGLINSITRIDVKRERLWSIPGNVPSASNFPAGCKFSDRCFLSTQKCGDEHPAMFEAETGHLSRCWHIDRLIEEIDKIRKKEIN